MPIRFLFAPIQGPYIAPLIPIQVVATLLARFIIALPLDQPYASWIQVRIRTRLHTPLYPFPVWLTPGIVIRTRYYDDTLIPPQSFVRGPAIRTRLHGTTTIQFHTPES